MLQMQSFNICSTGELVVSQAIMSIRLRTGLETTFVREPPDYGPLSASALGAP
jgi:hypothetical protein